jgi:hypothetical protein
MVVFSCNNGVVNKQQRILWRHHHGVKQRLRPFVVSCRIISADCLAGTAHVAKPYAGRVPVRYTVHPLSCRINRENIYSRISRIRGVYDLKPVVVCIPEGVAACSVCKRTSPGIEGWRGYVRIAFDYRLVWVAACT